MKTNDYIERLYGEAVKAMRNAVAPLSGFRVGAAVLTSSGEVYTGCNIENPSLMLSACAERVAILKAVSEGTRDIRAVMVVSDGGDYCYPCGSCRQLIYEFATGAEIFIAGGGGIKKYSIEELLPYAFKR
ncbi:MAG: cytidine deaminase [Nitrospirae bacterium]|nr:cytidine deaminase [Nitrospirota bacterium]